MSRTAPHTGRHRPPGRHRQPRRGHRPRTTLTPRLTVGTGVKALALAASAVGLATANALPPVPALQLTADSPRDPVPVHAAAVVTGPSQPPQFGLIGFSATATPTRAAAHVTMRTSDRSKEATSRGIRRTGLPPELGLTQPALVVLNAIRDNFPQIHSFGGYRPGDMDHGSGNAVDTMISSRAQGDAVAAYVIAHAAQLDVKYVIWHQRIWYPSSGAWRAMADRGSPTANHLDHVHVSVR